MTFNLSDVNVIEGENETTEEAYYLSIQRAINSGLWSLQGSYGRAMMEAIESGDCMLGRHFVRDFYGNGIPDRDQVKPGTKGSREFVVAHRGEGWAAMLEVGA